MKKVKRRAMSVLLIILCLMVGVGIFSYRFFHDGSQWVNFTANKHIYANGVLIGGAIYDRDGNPLVHTEDGVRKYSDNKNVRCATMHIVGDKKSNIATSLQKVYADELMGYNIIPSAAPATAFIPHWTPISVQPPISSLRAKKAPCVFTITGPAR